MRTWLLIASLFLQRSAFCQPIGFLMHEGARKTEIPFELVSSLIVVSARLNGGPELKFILDTGVRTCIILDKSITDLLRIKYSRKYNIRGMGQKRVTAYVASHLHLALGSTEGHNLSALVLEEDHLQLRNTLGLDIHGIIGYEFFSRFVVRIDYTDHQITLYSPQKFRRPRRFTILPLSLEDTKPYLTVRLICGDTSMQAKLMVDTGASHQLMLEPHRLRAIPEPQVDDVLGRGLGGEITGKVARVNLLQLGRYPLRQVVTDFPDPHFYMDTLITSPYPRNGTLGGGLLSKFTVIFNFPKGEMMLRKNSNFKALNAYNLSGLTLTAKGLDLKEFEVSHVRKNSAAGQAGIQPGDIITHIYHSPATSRTLYQLQELLNSRPGKKIKLTLSRQGILYQKVLRLRDDL